MPTSKKMPTVMRSGHEFSRVPTVGTSRSVFDRSHGYKTTFDSGLLIPIYVDEVLPGDTFTLRMTALARLTTPIKPFMDNLYLESFFFFVPYRLVWGNFVKFMGEQTNPGDSIAFTVPQDTISVNNYALHSVQDYFGLNSALSAGITYTHSALPLRAYKLVYNQWFRDENLINSVTVDTDDGPDAGASLSPYKRGKRHDYFTSCLPSPQKGAAVSLPLGGVAEVRPRGFLNTTPPYTTSPDAFPTYKDSQAGTNVGSIRAVGTAAFSAVQMIPAWGTNQALRWADPALQADLASATASTINDLRQSIGIQQFLERDARGGTRYTELIFSHFRVRSPDARLQRTEYLGGGSSPVMISPIAQATQTGLTGGTTVIGNLAGIGAAIAGGHGFTKSFTEHGVILGLVNVRADLTYSQGLERFWSRSTRYDFFWPVLEELGEQAVLNKEIFLSDTTPGAVFGYQERYAEYRYKPSKVTGLMNPSRPANLSIWNLTEFFGSLPTLGQTFIEDQTETVLDGRVAVPTEPDWYFDAFFDLKCARPMKVFGVPGMHRL